MENEYESRFNRFVLAQDLFYTNLLNQSAGLISYFSDLSLSFICSVHHCWSHLFGRKHKFLIDYWTKDFELHYYFNITFYRTYMDFLAEEETLQSCVWTFMFPWWHTATEWLWGTFVQIVWIIWQIQVNITKRCKELWLDNMVNNVVRNIVEVQYSAPSCTPHTVRETHEI